MAIETKLRRGELFEFPQLGDFPHDGVISKGTLAKNISDSSRSTLLAKKSRSLSDGENLVKSHRNFIWLPWANGGINYVESNGKDVLSGPFSGCYMIRYKHANGAWRVAHVDMPKGRAAWEQMAGENGFVIDCGFKPFRATTARKIAETAYEKTFGLVTGNGQCYRIVASKWVEPARTHRRIVEMERVDSLAPNTLNPLPI